MRFILHKKYILFKVIIVLRQMLECKKITQFCNYDLEKGHEYHIYQYKTVQNSKKVTSVTDDQWVSMF